MSGWHGPADASLPAAARTHLRIGVVPGAHDAGHRAAGVCDAEQRCLRRPGYSPQGACTSLAGAAARARRRPERRSPVPARRARPPRAPRYTRQQHTPSPLTIPSVVDRRRADHALCGAARAQVCDVTERKGDAPAGRATSHGCTRRHHRDAFDGAAFSVNAIMCLPARMVAAAARFPTA